MSTDIPITFLGAFSAIVRGGRRLLSSGASFMSSTLTRTEQLPKRLPPGSLSRAVATGAAGLAPAALGVLGLFALVTCALLRRGEEHRALPTRRAAGVLSLMPIWRCRRIERCRSRGSPYD